MKKLLYCIVLMLWCIAGSAAPVDLSEKESANCYIVRKGGCEYSFRADIKGNGIAPYGENPAINIRKIKAVKLLWQDADVVDEASVRLSAGRIIFRTCKKAQKGNAVIAVFSDSKADEGTCLWSWHIWFTDASDCAMAGITFLDRNLGADAPTLQDSGRNGCFYQWGRKDPFPQTGTLMDYLGGEKVSVEYTVAHPSRFVGREGRWTGFDAAPLWCKGSTAVDVDLQRVTPSTKTMYDPCPPGYHVPDLWAIKKIKGTRQHNFTKAGARWSDLDPETPDKVGEYGYYWTAFIDKKSDNRVSDYYIWSAGIGIGSQYYNCSGFMVRPQKF